MTNTENRKPVPERPLAHEANVSDHLANERTFLAWIRTSISLMGLGFVVAKFTLWLRELSARMDHPVAIPHSGLSMPLGIALMGLGGGMAVLSALRYRTVRRQILASQSADAQGTMIGVALVVAAISASLIAYMLISA